jgi:uncharacterized repeat protein (TIGR04076 family)
MLELFLCSIHPLFRARGWGFLSKVHKLVLTVKEVRGRCPVHKIGDKIVIEVPKIDTANTDVLCVHALGSMLSMLTALARGVSFKELGLATEEGNVGYVQCLDPGPPYTTGGTVLFEITRET